MESLGKNLVLIGIVLITVGFLMILGSKLGFGKLPGDIYYKKGNFIFYSPIMTSIILSILLTVIANMFFRR